MIYFPMFQARKTLRRLKGIVRLQKLTQGNCVRKQASTTLSYLSSWSRIQTQIRARRLCMVTEGRIRQKKLENQLKLDAKLHDLEVRLTFLQLWYEIFSDIMLVVKLFELKNIAIPMMHLEVPSMNSYILKTSGNRGPILPLLHIINSIYNQREIQGYRPRVSNIPEICMVNKTIFIFTWFIKY